MTTTQAAEYLGVTPSRLRQLIRAGALPATRRRSAVGLDYYTVTMRDLCAYAKKRPKYTRRGKEE